MMDEASYNQLVSAAFKRIMAAADALDPDDLEAESTGDMVTMTTPSREKWIGNTQRAVINVVMAGTGRVVRRCLRNASG